MIYQGLQEENLDQKSPGPPGWGLMQRANSLLITKRQEMLKNQTPSLGNQMEIDNLSIGSVYMLMSLHNVANIVQQWTLSTYRISNDKMITSLL